MKKQQIKEAATTALNAYSTGLLQGKAYRILNNHLTRTLLQFDLSIPEWKLLGQLYDHGNMKLATLAEKLSVEAPLVTALVDHLEKKELVKRDLDKVDKRAKVIIVTKKGKELIPPIEKEVKKLMETLLTGISKKDIFTYLRVLSTIVNNG